MKHKGVSVGFSDYVSLLRRFSGRIFHRIEITKEKHRPPSRKYFVKSSGSKSVTIALEHYAHTRNNAAGAK